MRIEWGNRPPLENKRAMTIRRAPSPATARRMRSTLDSCGTSPRYEVLETIALPAWIFAEIGVLGFVGQRRAPVFQLRDLGPWLLAIAMDFSRH